MNEQGFVHLRGVYDDAMVEALRASVDGARTVGRAWVGPWLAKEQPAELEVGPAIHKREPWAHALEAPALKAAILELLGPEATCNESLAIIKPPLTGQPFPWHQDSTYYGNKHNERYVIAHVYLDDVTADNGSLQFIAGSHLKGALTHQEQGNKRVLPLPSDVVPVKVEAKAGDVVLFDIHLIHGSEPNRSDRPRRSVRLVYRAPR